MAASATVGRASTVVDNSSNLYLDALVNLVIVSSASALAGTKAVYVFAYCDVSATPTYLDGVTGSDAGFTRTDPPNLRLIGVMNIPSTATTYRGGSFSVAAAFGGILPNKWGIVICNDTGQALGTGCSANFIPVYATST